MLSRKLICLICLVLTAVLAGNALADTLTWDDGGSDHFWSTAANWSGDTLPTSADKAKIGMLPGPTIANPGAVADNVPVADGSSTGALTVDGGTLTTTKWIILAYGAGSNGTVNMNSGTVNVGDKLFVGFDGTGTFNMNGGAITVNMIFTIARNSSSAVGHVNLDGGTISTAAFSMRDNGGVGTMNITAGTLIIDGDVRSTVQAYINNGWITAYEGTGTINMDYNDTNPGKTTLTATEDPPAPPGQATNPSPVDEAIDQSINVNLSWTAGIAAVSHDVYFGTDSTPDATEFQGNRTATIFDPGTLAYSTTYYWRIDEVNPQGTTTGVVWSFTTEATPAPPGQATNPSPANGAGDQSIYASLIWTAGTGAVSSHDVYFGTDSTPDATEFQGNQTATIFNPGTLANSTTYYWRIDEVGPGGTTTGVVWSFTTEVTTTIKLWDDDSADHLWSTPANWDPDAVPDAADNVRIDIADAIVSVSDTNAICYTMQMQSPGGHLDVNETLRGELVIDNSAYLDNGLIRADTVIMDTNSLLDVSRGELILGGVHSSKISRYIDNGLVTAYGGDPLGVPIVDYDEATNQTRLAALSKTGCPYLVQSGRVKVTGLSLDVPIRPVSDLARAFVLLSQGTGYGFEAQNANEVQVTGYLSAPGNIHISRNTNVNSTWVSYQVIECLSRQFRVYRGGGTMTTGESSKLINIGATVAPANCLAYVTADSDSASRTYYHESMLTARVSSPTQVTIERETALAAAPQFRWIVVEFDPTKIGSIQHGSTLVNDNTYSSPKTVAINTIDPTHSILIFQARSNENGLARTAWAGNITSATQLAFYQHRTASGYADIEWYVIDFGEGSAQRGQINKASDSESDFKWAFAKAELSPSVYTKALTIHFHSMTCNQTNDSYPRAFSTAELTSTSTLRIQRIYHVNRSYIEWQVLEFPYTPPTLAADLNKSGRVDLIDFAILGGQWQQAPSEPSADIAPPGGDGVVNFFDLDVMTRCWLDTAP